MNYLDYLGFFAVFLLVLANTISFFQYSYREKKSFFYLNLIGSVLLVPNDFFHGSMPSVAIGLFFIFVSIFSLSNNNKLSHKSFNILTFLFSIFWIYHIYGIVSIQEVYDEKFIFDMLAIISVGVSVLCYGLFSSHKISVVANIIISLIATLIIMPSLYYLDNNIAQLGLKIYILVISVLALIKHKFWIVRPL